MGAQWQTVRSFVVSDLPQWLFIVGVIDGRCCRSPANTLFYRVEKRQRAEVTLIQLICPHLSLPSHMKPTLPLWSFFFKSHSKLPLSVRVSRQNTNISHSSICCCCIHSHFYTIPLQRKWLRLNKRVKTLFEKKSDQFSPLTFSLSMCPHYKIVLRSHISNSKTIAFGMCESKESTHDLSEGYCSLYSLWRYVTRMGQ